MRTESWKEVTLYKYVQISVQYNKFTIWNANETWNVLIAKSLFRSGMDMLCLIIVMLSSRCIQAMYRRILNVISTSEFNTVYHLNMEYCGLKTFNYD